MTLISYAQNFEDVMLLRALDHVAEGCYIDIGAADPDEDSVTKVFYDRGWRGVNIEPSPQFFERLRAARPRDVNLNVAVADVSGTLPFFEIDLTGLSTLDKDVAGVHRSAGRAVDAAVVEVTTLADLCRTHVHGPVHFLKIDVEGAERAVLAGADFNACRPWIVLVEATRPLTKEQTHEQWETLLEAADYRFAWFDGLNRFYIAAEHWQALSHAFSSPPNVFDDFARLADAAFLGQQTKAQAEAIKLRADETERHLALAKERLKHLESQLSRAETRATRAEELYEDATTRGARSEASLAQAQAALGLAVDQIAAMRATTSWSITAPLRATKLAISGHAGLALAEVGVPFARLHRLKRVGGESGSKPKRLIRVAIYVLSRLMVRFPVMTKAASVFERVAPGPYDWLQKRIDAYSASARTTRLPPETFREGSEQPPPVPTVQANFPAAFHRTRSVHQFHSGSATGDAITNSMFLIQQWLRKLGYRSEIFVEHRDLRLADRLFEIGDLPSHGDCILIVHHSLGYDALSQIVALPARKILMYHNITPGEFLSDFPTMIPYSNMGRRQLEVLRPHIHSALADSEFNALELRGYGYDAPVACPFLFDVDELISKAGEAPPRPPDAPYTWLFVGRLVASKGQADLVEAFAEFRRVWARPCRLVLVGRMAAQDAAYPCEVRRRITAHELDTDVVITGPVSEDKLHAWYRAADVFVSLSHHEGFGVPLIEAMVYDVPVVAWPAGAVPYTLADCGELLPDRSPAVTAAAVLRVASDPKLRMEILDRQRRVLDGFRLDRHLPRLLQALASAGAAPSPEDGAQAALGRNLHFAITGHVSHTYSLSSVNRQMALALEASRPGKVRLVPVEGGALSDISMVPSWQAIQMGALVRRPVPSTGPEVVISQHYPVHVPERRGDLTAAMVFWEESLVPLGTIRLLNDTFDAVFAPSRIVAKTLIDSGLSIPVRVVGYAPDLAAFHQLERESRRSERLVTLLHVSSCFPRKGVDVLLAAYAKAFQSGDPVRLVVKGFPNPHNDVPEQIEQLRERNPRLAEIVMINNDLSDSALLDLYRKADAVVLPTRGEGFNIPAAEAMAAGIPLIVTAQGGHLDFCTAHDARLIDYHFAPSASHLATSGSVWLEPEVDDLADALREVVRDLLEGQGAALIRAAKARDAIGTRLDPNRWADRLSDTAVELLTRPKSLSLRLAWVSTWGVACGIAEYSRSLLEGFGRGPNRMSTVVLCDDRTSAATSEAGLAVYPTWCVSEVGDMRRMARTVANVDANIVVVQYHEGLFHWRALVAFLSDLRLRNRVTVVTLHAVQRLGDLDPEDLSIIIETLGRTNRVLVHRIADLELLKGFGLEQNVTLIPQGAPAQLKSTPARMLSNHDTALIGCYGFFLPGKGIGRLIKAFAQLHQNWPNLRLRLVNAEYPYIDSALEIAQCRELAQSLDVEHMIEWETSFKPQEQCQLLLSECDLVALPYDDSKESSSAALRGALSSGSPVAVTPVAIFDEADDAVHRFAATDVSSIAAGIDALLCDVQARRRIQMAASQWLADHQWSIIAERMEGMLKGLHAASETTLQ